MKVHVDMNLCQSHGECVFPAPDIFELGDDDVLRWKEDIDESRRAARRGGRQRLPDDGDPHRGLMARLIVIVGALAGAGLRAAQAARGRAGTTGDARRRGRRAAPALHAPAAVQAAAGRRAGARATAPSRPRARRRVAPGRRATGSTWTATRKTRDLLRRRRDGRLRPPDHRHRRARRARGRATPTASYTLRELDDALALRAALDDARRGS